MRSLITAFFCFLIISAGLSCRKKHAACKSVTVHAYYTCNTFGVQFDGDPFLYQCYTLPAQYHVEGARLCITYTISDDMRACPTICCGGKIVTILSVN